MEIARDSTVMLRIRSGVRPSRPPDLNVSWSEWGLTADIWTFLEDCWKQDPPRRPTVEETVAHLSKGLTQDLDTRWTGGDSEGVSSPTRFRNSVGRHSRIQDVPQLEALVFKGRSTSTQSPRQFHLFDHGQPESLYIRTSHLLISGD
jgi:hypothetical protein